jgi:hypothetical protein
VVARTWSLAPGHSRSFTGVRVVALFIAGVSLWPPTVFHPASTVGHGVPALTTAPSTPVGNFSASINRLVDLVALAGSGILALVWARVALSWFSNDITKKIQAKDRARDALIGTLLFMAAVTGLFYGLAHWVLTGS